MLDLQANTGIISSLLSRFDLIFVMIDEVVPETDMLKADHILAIQCVESSQKRDTRRKLWSEDDMREYINFVQKVFEPVVTEEAETVLNAYYSYLRQNPRVSKDRKSVRMLESLIRLSEAHARLLMKSKASMYDAVSVIVLMEHTLMTCLFGADVPPSVLFRDACEYEEIKELILHRLSLPLEAFTQDLDDGELDMHTHSPTPIKRLEQSFLISGKGNATLDLSMTQSQLDEHDFT